MKSRFARTISLLLTAVMLLSMIIVPAFAAETTADDTAASETDADPAAEETTEQTTEQTTETGANEVFTEEDDITAAGSDRTRPVTMSNPLDVLSKNLVYAENTGSRYKLAYDPETYNVIINDTQNNTVWQTNPVYNYPNLDIEPSVEGLLKSHMNIEYIFDAADAGDEASSGGLRVGDRVEKYFSSYLDCIQVNQLEVEPLADGSGFTFVYNIGNMRPYTFPKIIKKETFEAYLETIDKKSVRKKIEANYVLTSLADYDKLIAETTDIASKNRLIDEKNAKANQFPFLRQYDVYMIEQSLLTNTSFVKKTNEFESLWIGLGMTYDEILEWHKEIGFNDPWKLVGITLPVEFKIDGDEFVASILTQDERCYIQAGCYITKIDFMPGLCSAELDDKGYFMMPDGSGSIVDINPKDSRFSEVSINLYSNDNAFTQPVSLPYFEQSVMPVYGIKQSSGAIFANIEGMSEYCSIFSKIGRSADPYARIYPQFKLTVFDEAQYKTTTTTRMMLFPRIIRDKKKYGYIPESNISVRYSFLYGDKANYSGMAEVYRKYLVDKYKLEKVKPESNIPFYADLMGVIDKRVAILGVPVELKYSLTDFKEAETILQSLSDQGIENITARYLGAVNGGLINEVNNKLKIMNQLGGKKGLQKLREYTDSKGYDLYLDFEMLYIYRDKMFDGYDPNDDSSYNLLGNVSIISESCASTGEPAGWSRPRYVVSPKFYDELFDKFYNAAEKEKLFNCLSLSSLGRDLNSDYKRNEIIGKLTGVAAMLKNVQKFKDSGYNIMVETGNSYIAPYADVILNIPVTSSKFYIESYYIPFYQMALHGYVEYAGSPLNWTQNQKRSILQSIEYGLGVYAKLMYNPDIDLFDTEFEDDHYSLHYANWLTESGVIYGAVNEALKDLQDKPIINHEVLENKVVRVTYEGGTTFILNYNRYDVTVDGQKIPAEDYIRIGG